MSADEYPSIFSSQMKAIVYISMCSAAFFTSGYSSALCMNYSFFNATSFNGSLYIYMHIH